MFYYFTMVYVLIYTKHNIFVYRVPNSSTYGYLLSRYLYEHVSYGNIRTYRKKRVHVLSVLVLY